MTVTIRDRSNNEELQSAKSTVDFSAVVYEGFAHRDGVPLDSPPPAGSVAKSFKSGLAFHQPHHRSKHQRFAGSGQDVSRGHDTIWHGTTQSRHDYRRPERTGPPIRRRQRSRILLRDEDD